MKRSIINNVDVAANINVRLRTRGMFRVVSAALFAALYGVTALASQPPPDGAYIYYLSISFSDNPNAMDSYFEYKYQHGFTLPPFDPIVPVDELEGRKLYAHLTCFGPGCSEAEPIEVDCESFEWSIVVPGRPAERNEWHTGCSVVYPPPFQITPGFETIEVIHPQPNFASGAACLVSATSVRYPLVNKGSSTRPQISLRGRMLNVRVPQSSGAASQYSVRLIDLRGKTAARFRVGELGAGSFSLAKVSAGRYLVEVRKAGARVNTASVIVGVR